MVDDEHDVLEVESRMLKGLGYTTINIDSPEKALALLTRENPGIDLLVTDMNMPKMDGLELSKALRDGGMTIPIILLSGYTGMIDHAAASRYGISNLLQKPPSRKELAVQVRKTLDAVNKQHHTGK